MTTPDSALEGGVGGRDVHDADDVAQETWIRALERPPGDAHGLRPWLASVTRGLVRNRRRATRRREHREAAVARDEAVADPVRVLALSEPYRSVVALAYDQGLTHAEIAARLGIAPATFRTRLHRAHQKLREQLDRGGADSGRLAALVALAQEGPPRAPS
ncbi:MAG: sigma-70 family RNA polymerase sigma factor [bacterium]|nr:sigma-70 family RNA polymerase sigma factor [bacterium]